MAAYSNNSRNGFPDRPPTHLSQPSLSLRYRELLTRSANLLFLAGVLFVFALSCAEETGPNVIPKLGEGPIVLLNKKQLQFEASLQGDRPETGPLTIYNLGNQDLVVERIKTSCSCMPSNVKTPVRIKSGESREITFVLETGAKEGDYKYQAAFYTNAVNAPVEIVELVGSITPAITTDQNVISLGPIHLWNESPIIRIQTTVNNLLDAKALRLKYIPQSLIFLGRKSSFNDGSSSEIFEFRISTASEVDYLDDFIEFELKHGERTAVKRVYIAYSAFRDCAVTPFPVSAGFLQVGVWKHHRIRLQFRKEIDRIRISVSNAKRMRIDEVIKDSAMEYTFVLALCGGGEEMVDRQFVEIVADTVGDSDLFRMIVPVIGING